VVASGANRKGREPDEQARVEWRLEKLRINAIIEAALPMDGETQREARCGRRRLGSFREVQEGTCREIAPDAQWLKIALRAAERLQQLMASPPTCEEVTPSNSAHEGRTNWHKWHTPLGADLVATDDAEHVPQVTTPQQVDAASE
jgi:hypothetical protein